MHLKEMVNLHSTFCKATKLTGIRQKYVFVTQIRCTRVQTSVVFHQRGMISRDLY